MNRSRERTPGGLELRVAWLFVGLLGAVVHWPWTAAIMTVFAVPWLVGLLLLFRGRTLRRLSDALRAALATRAGAAGATVLTFTAVCTAIVVAPGAGVLLAVWMSAVLFLVALFRPANLAEQLAGWAVVAFVTGSALVAAEAVLRLPRVAAAVGTPIEIDRWWQRYDDLWLRNVLGLRSPYETLRKPPGVVRIAALGDSYTWGDKIASSDSTWPARLEEELRRKTQGTEIEVVNLGEKGFTTVNEAEMLRRLGWQFDPDIVLVQFYLNDVMPSGPNFERGYSGWIFPRAWILPERYRSGPAGRSALLHLAEGVLSARRHGDRTAQAAKWTEVYERRGPEWQAMAGALAEMGEAASKRGVPIVLVLFPDFIPGMAEAAELPFHSIHEQVREAAAAAGFRVLDLTDAFIRENPEMRAWWAAPYDAHPNAAAADLAGREIADFLLETLGPVVWGSTAPPGPQHP